MTLRLLADDLTGALDSAAPFCAGGSAVTVHLGPGTATGGDAAVLDIGTRELGAGEAATRAAQALPFLREGSPAFFKIDSLLRGPWAVQLTALLRDGGFRHCVLAPAFPAQGRITERGLQVLVGRDGSRVVVGDIAAMLAAAGLAHPPGAASAGDASVGIHDAADESDLHAAVAAGRAAEERTLWCGSAGLAHALAGGIPPRSAALPAPLLAVIGTDHPVTLTQVAVAQRALPLRASIALDGSGGASSAIRHALAEIGVALVTVSLPSGIASREARECIAARLAAVLPKLAPPASLVATGGETLRAICEAVGATRLALSGELEPGIPVSTMTDGVWRGVTVASKSGAFGTPARLAEIFCEAISHAPFAASNMMGTGRQ